MVCPGGVAIASGQRWLLGGLLEAQAESTSTGWRFHQLSSFYLIMNHWSDSSVDLEMALNNAGSGVFPW